MTGRNAAWPRSAHALLVLGHRCASFVARRAQAEVATLAAEFDPEANLRLPGYRAGVVNAPVSGGEAFVMEAGQAMRPTVVRVHGLGDSGARDFYPVLPSLRALHHVVAFDGRVGVDPWPRALTHQRVNVELHPRGWDRRRPGPSISGRGIHGGALALLYAASFPMEVSRLHCSTWRESFIRRPMPTSPFSPD